MMQMHSLNPGHFALRTRENVSRLTLGEAPIQNPSQKRSGAADSCFVLHS
jgi:hypothetical protein